MDKIILAVMSLRKRIGAMQVRLRVQGKIRAGKHSIDMPVVRDNRRSRLQPRYDSRLAISERAGKIESLKWCQCQAKSIYMSVVITGQKTFGRASADNRIGGRRIIGAH